MVFLFEENDTGGENENLTEFNRPIDAQEIREAIRKLKSSKAHGCDRILANMLKLAGDTAVQFLTKLFNAVCDEGVCPEEWPKAIIIPLF